MFLIAYIAYIDPIPRQLVFVNDSDEILFHLSLILLFSIYIVSLVGFSSNTKSDYVLFPIS